MSSDLAATGRYIGRLCTYEAMYYERYEQIRQVLGIDFGLRDS